MVPWRVIGGVNAERDDGGVFGCSDGHVVVAGHECAFGVPDGLLADFDGAVEDVQVGVPAWSCETSVCGAV